MQCPICKTNITNPDATKCSQCDSDLEVFKTLGQLKNETSSNTKIGLPELSLWPSNWLIWLASILFFVAILALIYRMQTTMLYELSQERTGRQQSEERTAKITEKFIEKTTESFANTMQTMLNANKDQRTSIELLNEKIIQLEENTKQLEENAKKLEETDKRLKEKAKLKSRKK